MIIRRGPDEDLLEAVLRGERKLACRVWEPQTTAVVLGRSSPLSEVNLQKCKDGGIPVLRRKGGGCSVVLAKGMLVVSVAWRVKGPIPQDVLRSNAETLSKILSVFGIASAPAGYGDLAIGDRKIMGATLYITASEEKRVLFYQASLLVNADVGLIEALLNRPSREPPYRRGRSHREFLTTLWEAGYRVQIDLLASQILKNITSLAPGISQNQRIPPPSPHPRSCMSG